MALQGVTSELAVSLGDRSYAIFIGAGLITSDICARFVVAEQALVVTNEVVAEHYLAPLTAALQAVECGTCAGCGRVCVCGNLGIACVTGWEDSAQCYLGGRRAA